MIVALRPGPTPGSGATCFAATGNVAAQVDREAHAALPPVPEGIHRHANELTEVSAVSGWIHEIVRNAIVDRYRRAVVRREQPVGAGLQLDPRNRLNPNRSAEARTGFPPVAGRSLGCSRLPRRVGSVRAHGTGAGPQRRDYVARDGDHP